MLRPTKKQTELLEYLKGFIGAACYGPSYREIQSALGYKSVSTVATHIDGLVKAGKIYKKDFSARSIEIADSSNTLTDWQQKWLLKKANELGFENAKNAMSAYVKSNK